MPTPRKKQMILVTSPPACGKTYISQQIARRLPHVVYLDKDLLIPLSNRVFAVAQQQVNRSSPFFQQNIRDYEYQAIVGIGLAALQYEDTVLINAPFTREVHSLETLQAYEKRLAQLDARLVVVWVVTDPEVCHQRMIARNSDRDTWKLTHWEQYVKTVDYSVPAALQQFNGGENLLLFYNSNDQEFDQSMQRILPLLTV